MNVVQTLYQMGLIPDCPFWLPDNISYLTITGSIAYGISDVSDKTKKSDYDVYGFAIPPKPTVFPHLSGYVDGFGDPPQRFDQWQKHHIEENALNGKGKEWDFTIFSIVRFFELCRQNNPNMLDSLFTPENCVLYCTQIGRMVRDNRKKFLSKLVWKKMRSYAWMQLKKEKNVVIANDVQEVLDFEIANNIPRTTTFSQVKAEWTNRSLITRNNKDHGLSHLNNAALNRYFELYEKGMNGSKRFENRKVTGKDSKFLYNIIRLFDESEQVLLEGNIDLQRSKETMKAVRRGDWSSEDVVKWAIEKEKSLEVAYTNCTLPEVPPFEPLKQLLLQCLEQHYGSLEKCIVNEDWAQTTLKEVDSILGKIRKNLY